MPDHVRNRPHRLRVRTQRRPTGGFSLLEVTISLAVFAVVVGMLSMSVATSVAARATMHVSTIADEAVGRALEAVATSDYSDLVTGSFIPPDRCTDTATATGTDAASCIVASGRSFRVAYEVQLGDDSAGRAGRPLDVADNVTITATTELPNGATFTRNRTVVAPSPGYSASLGVVRVRVDGDLDSFDGPLYLVREASPTTVVAAAPVPDDGVVVLRGDPSDCTAASPCRLALSPGASYAATTMHTLRAADVSGTSSKIVLTAGGFAEAAASIVETATASIELWAANDLGTRRQPTITGSVCVWLSFDDGFDTRRVPACNTSSAGRITFGTYVPDATQPAQSLTIPAGTPITLTTDHPDGHCGDTGSQQRGFTATAAANLQANNATAWAARYECTGYTWGVPASFGPLGEATAITSGRTIFTLTPGEPNHFELVWSGTSARPATGISSQYPWSKPRAARACSTTAPGVGGACTSTIGTDPDSACGGTVCTSNANSSAHLTSPTGSYTIAGSGGATTAFSLFANDGETNAITMRLTRLPSSGSLTYLGVPVGLNGVIGGASAAPPMSRALVFNGVVAAGSAVTFEITLETIYGNQAYEIGIYPSSVAWELRTHPLAARQGATHEVRAVVKNVTGGARVGATVTFTRSDTTFTLSSATAVTDANGVATVDATFATTPEAGAKSITVSVEGRSASIPVTVADRPGSLTVTATTSIAQGATGTISVTARDKANVLRQHNVVLSILDGDGNPAQGIYPVEGGCRTAAASPGCSLTIAVDGGARRCTSCYTVLVQSDPGVQAIGTLSVTSVVQDFDVTETRVAQGGSTSMTVIATDGAGQPMAGVAVSASPAGGLSVPGSPIVTNGAGQAIFTLNASSSAPAGPSSVDLTAGSATGQVPVVIAPTAASITMQSPSIIVPQDDDGTIGVIVVDGAGAPMAGAVVETSGAGGLIRTSAKATSNAAGIATIRVYAMSGASGLRVIEVTHGTLPSVSFQVTAS